MTTCNFGARPRAQAVNKLTFIYYEEEQLDLLEEGVEIWPSWDTLGRPVMNARFVPISTVEISSSWDTLGRLVMNTRFVPISTAFGDKLGHAKSTGHERKSIRNGICNGCPKNENDAILGSLMIHPVLRYLANALAGHPIYVPGEISIKLVQISDYYDSPGEKGHELDMIELSGSYLTFDMPRYPKDYAKGY
ncbi:1245_t:CDS:2 [Acaulospora morrowiae]|uniref:1245_t:CDS:1 n=1 Tax=Acaulospora morrowiae TaxID=94023 RepID=A0A9N8WKJ4_9GLOM|nr:1245_t:CDS:2 [Acaulospora morrowiae]